MQSFIHLLYTYGEEISLISGIISILSAIGTVISYLKIKIGWNFTPFDSCNKRRETLTRSKRNVSSKESCNNEISNNNISNSKIVLKNSSNNVVAIVCFFGFLSLAVICATICVVVYFVTH